jgi:hypothetical protein
MKKTVIALLISCASVGLAFSYKLTIKNEINSQITAKVIYAGEAVCSPTSKIIAAKEEYHIDTALCCPKLVNFTVNEGRAIGKSLDWVPPTTGAGISCRDTRVTVKLTQDNNVVAEHD